MIGAPENGPRQFYNLTEALAMASWLNVFVRHADVVDIACHLAKRECHFTADH